VTIPQALASHLESFLGEWPPPSSGLTVVESDRRTQPGWDGAIRPVRGVATPFGTILSVPPGSGDRVRALGDTLDTVGPLLPQALAHPTWRFNLGVFRWSDGPADLGNDGVWVPPTTEGVPAWLAPFNGDVLVGCADGEVAAGVGRKRHDRWGHELAVVTEEPHRGQGWASRLVAQAARHVIAEGAAPIYLHAPSNTASARTADTAGFPDRGWKIVGMFPASR
jgi:GNAT superfamily N-acetyltransferase